MLENIRVYEKDYANLFIKLAHNYYSEYDVFNMAEDYKSVYDGIDFPAYPRFTGKINHQTFIVSFSDNFGLSVLTLILKSDHAYDVEICHRAIMDRIQNLLNISSPNELKNSIYPLKYLIKVDDTTQTSALLQNEFVKDKVMQCEPFSLFGFKLNQMIIEFDCNELASEGFDRIQFLLPILLKMSNTIRDLRNK